MDVNYAIETYPELSVEDFIDILRRSTLGERRPIDDPETIRGMLEHADVIITARIDGRLVGISRAITDFHYCTQLSDLAVDEAYQRRGIGKELIRRTHEAAGPGPSWSCSRPPRPGATIRTSARPTTIPAGSSPASQKRDREQKGVVNRPVARHNAG